MHHAGARPLSVGNVYIMFSTYVRLEKLFLHYFTLLTPYHLTVTVNLQTF